MAIYVADWSTILTNDTLGVAWGRLGGLAQQFPTAAQGARLVPVREEAIMPQAHETVG